MHTVSFLLTLDHCIVCLVRVRVWFGADGATRLVSNAFPSTTDPGDTAGRLEIYNSGQWGTVCDYFFGMTDADVVCK